LYRYNPELAELGKNPFSLDSRKPKLPLEKYIYREGRYRMLTKSNPEAAERLLDLAKADVMTRWNQYEDMAAQNGKGNGHKK
jgi:pyruvate-ferredoxin/flavodoxin oxidoreductase